MTGYLKPVTLNVIQKCATSGPIHIKCDLNVNSFKFAGH